MNRINRCAAAVVLTLVACAPAPATTDQPAKAAPIEGTWKIVDVTGTGTDSSATNHNPQPSIVTFGPKYYSWAQITSSAPRTLFKKLKSTDAEHLAAYDSFVANSGTYDKTDSTVTIHPVVARVPNFVQETYHFRVSGDTAWLQNASTESRFRIGTEIVAGDAGGTTKLTLVRMK